MNKNITPLQRFWMALVYDYNKSLMDEADWEDAQEIAMIHTQYYPIDTKFCMVYDNIACHWALVTASGSKIVTFEDCGTMEDME